MGNVRLYGSTSGYTELAPPAVAPDGVLSLPSGTGTLATQAYVDTAESDAIAASGLRHINTTTFTAQSSISLDNVFTSTYQNYRVIIALSVSATMNVQARLRASGTDNSGTNYQQNRIGVANGSALANRAAAETTWDLINIDSGYRSGVSLDIFGPQIAATTLAHNIAGPNVDQTGANWRFVITGHEHNQSTSYDGLTLLASTGNITGTIRVYGYKNS